MHENKNVGLLCSWPVIIAAIVLFWPVGVILLLRRASKVTQTARWVGKLLVLLGWLTWALTVVGVISCIAQGFRGSDAMAALILAVFGFILLTIGYTIEAKAVDSEKYRAVIGNGLRRLDEIGAAVGKDYKQVKKDLEEMIKKGRLEGAYINESTYELVIPKDMEMPAEKKPEGRKVKCAGCGAANTVYGDTGECEYCGSILK